MSRKLALVTGSNTGIGLEIVRQLSKQFDGDVCLTARNIGRGQAAVESLKKEGFRPVFRQLDVDSVDSIQECRDSLIKDYGGINILVNNAGNGVDVPDQGENAERMVRTNTWGAHHVFQAFLPHLQQYSRIVNVGSRFAYYQLYRGHPDVNDRLVNKCDSYDKLRDLMGEYITAARDGTRTANGWDEDPYNISKIAAIVLTRLQQREIEMKYPNRGILVNACCPGLVDTVMSGNLGVSVEKGAETPVYLSLLPQDARQPSGQMVAEKVVLPFNTHPESAKSVMHQLAEKYPAVKQHAYWVD